jgi:NAD(P)-dependent dehydrogenase (short-subunit alcohol dehydrogenase family)
MRGIDHARNRRARCAVVHAIENATDPAAHPIDTAALICGWVSFSRMSPNNTWTTADVPEQGGRVAVVTGANTGIGYHTAAVLAQSGAHVVLAVRNLEKGNLALARIVAADPNADVTLQELDLSSLDSVRAAATALRSAYPRIDLLINNAGVMWTPKQLTADGFELQFGTNHLGHFALTGLLLDNLLPVRGSRVVTVSSTGHRFRAAIHFDDLQWEHHYDRYAAYGQSKLANLLFTYELQRRLAGHQKNTIAVAAHPGAASTELQRNVPTLVKPLFALAGPLLFQNAAMGALPTLRAAADPDVEGGQYYGPDGLGEQRGHPKLVSSSAQSHDEDVQHRLWQVSEELTGVTYPV